MLGVVLSWIGALIICYGRRISRHALFPVLLVTLMIPLPLPVLDSAIALLQHSSANLSEALFRLTGVPVLRIGMVFSLPTLAIEVAKECSSIRSSIAMLLTFLIVGYVTMDSISHRVILLLAVIPVAIFKNGLRIVTLSLLAMYVDPSFLTGNLHNRGGVVFYLIGLAMLLPLVRALRKLERRAVPTESLAAAATAP
jgi:exosortase